MKVSEADRLAQIVTGDSGGDLCPACVVVVPVSPGLRVLDVSSFFNHP